MANRHALSPWQDILRAIIGSIYAAHTQYEADYLNRQSVIADGQKLLSKISGLGGSPDVVVAAVELLFFVLATLDVTAALLGFFFGWLGLVVSLRATNKMASKPSSPSPFSEGLFLVLAGLGILSQGES